MVLKILTIVKEIKNLFKTKIHKLSSTVKSKLWKKNKTIHVSLELRNI